MEIKDLIRKQRLKLGLTLSQVAKAANVSEATVSRWESGNINSMKQNRLLAVSKILQIPLASLLGDSEVAERLKFKVPVLGYVAGGIPIEAIENVIDYEELPASLAQRGEYFGLVISGQSMSPIICDGDTVIVRQQSDVDNGEIGIVLIENNEATCKKIIKQNDGLMLVSYNSDYNPLFYSNEDIEKLPITIIGKVIELRRSF